MRDWLERRLSLPEVAVADDLSDHFDAPPPQSLDDYGAEPRPDPVQPPYAGRNDWTSLLLCNSHDRPFANLANAVCAMRHAPELSGCLGYDEFKCCIMVLRRLPWDGPDFPDGGRRWSDNDDRCFAEWFQRRGVNIAVRTAGDAADTVAHEFAFHPVREYLASLTWDGVPRLTRWLPTYLGAAATTYELAVGERYLISAVARIMSPGCKVDCMLVMESGQGAGKSRALMILAGPWFTDRVSEFRGKEGAQELNGVWIVEIAELDGMERASIATMKAFLSRTVDRYRAAYGRRVEEFPRQCVFAGTVNPEDGYLRDATGARRFWPVACGSVDIEALTRDRDQLWAEAVVRYGNREVWHLNTPELEALAAEHQRERYQTDPWEPLIEKYLDTVRPTDPATPFMVAIEDILRTAIGLDPSRWTQADQSRVARSLVSRAFVRKRVPLNGARKWRYVAPPSECPPCPR